MDEKKTTRPLRKSQRLLQTHMEIINIYRLIKGRRRMRTRRKRKKSHLKKREEEEGGKRSEEKM